MDRLKTVREKHILKPWLVQKSYSTKEWQSYFSLLCVASSEAWVPPFNPFAGARSWKRSLVLSRQLKPDYMDSHQISETGK